MCEFDQTIIWSFLAFRFTIIERAQNKGSIFFFLKTCQFEDVPKLPPYKSKNKKKRFFFGYLTYMVVTCQSKGSVFFWLFDLYGGNNFSPKWHTFNRIRAAFYIENIGILLYF